MMMVMRINIIEEKFKEEGGRSTINGDYTESSYNSEICYTTLIRYYNNTQKY